MATLVSSIAAFTRSVIKTPELSGYGFQQVRNKWADWRMLRDYNRRMCVKEHAKERVRLISIKRNDILPIELKEIAGADIDALPRNSQPCRVKTRCMVTSRPRGVVHRWRVSRIVFRHLADYNKLAGVQRAMW
ncbi:28S ribosomal protein S14, mitochondrial [Orussus abietinus]|uniref:28S ribosomal protein S14, mitochondrial n=1 Tax=Orussus abietinus TaxID=222816 RepID=UPI0006253C11|nr:28S ribosomal protein S14, mitochondrial [Orussus abietinus]